MTEWLETSVVKAALGSSLSDDLDDGAMDMAAAAARRYVERKRADLFVTEEESGDPDETVQVFIADDDIVLGGCLLAYRWYSRRTHPLGILGYTDDGASGILRDDPDIARLLGIGVQSGGFVFGAPTIVEESA